MKQFSSKKFRQARLRAGFTVTDLFMALSGRRYRPSLSTLYNWDTGKKAPMNITFVRPVAEKLGVSVDDLYE
jgi:hypothetical protein